MSEYAGYHQTDYDGLPKESLQKLYEQDFDILNDFDQILFHRVNSFYHSISNDLLNASDYLYFDDR